MAKLESYNFDDVLQNDELEEREMIANENKQKKKRRRKRRRKIFIVLLMMIAIVYAISDYSNVRIVEITGNRYYSKQQVMNIAGLSYDMKSILAPSFLMNKRLEDDPLISNAKISKTWDGIINIKIEEQKLIGYYIKDGKNYLIVDSEDDILIEDDNKLANVPYLVDLNKKQIASYKEAIQDVEKESVWLISEISHYETSYDKNMLKLTMQDGHVVFTTFAGLNLLDSYTEMLKELRTDLKCIVFAEETNTMYSEKCE